MRFRQIHLDFHTSGRIPGVGSRFDAAAFGKAFKAAHVDSVTVFSKCHHGYSYHPTEVGTMHPHLEFDLLRAQIDALHAEGINAPIYIAAAWDELAAFEHPEWRIVAPDGTMPRFRTDPLGAGWAFLDFSTPYLDHLCRQIDELMTRYPDGDGVFVDISFQLPTVSAAAQAKMEAQGLDWTRAEDREAFSAQSVENYFKRVSETVRKHDPDKPLFFNSGHMRRGLRDHYKSYYTHLEVESLPTAGWGYDHFPLSARYIDPLGIPFLGMTGKFHFHWGEVGGYKKPEALVYECGAMLAHGARCSIGDHLHPTGAVDPSTMAVIAPAYKWVEEREAWAEGSTNRAEIALLSVEAASRPKLVGVPGHHVGSDEGASRVLLEGKFTFDLIDLDSALEGYRLVILPDAIAVDASLKAKLEAYAAKGGRVLLTGKSGIDPERGFVLDTGARWEGSSEMSGGDYLMPIPALRAEFVDQPLFTYLPSERIKVTGGTSLGDVYDPYFDRQPQHFSGHIHTPSQPDPSGFAAGVEKGNLSYLAHPIFACYHRAGSVAMLEIAEKAILRALGAKRMVETSLPRAGRVTVRSQPQHGRDVVHLLYATPALRGNLRSANIQPIQELVTLHDAAVSVEATGTVAGVRRVPTGEALPFEVTAGRVRFTVPELTGHEMVEISYR
jgi:hypothetical protein